MRTGAARRKCAQYGSGAGESGLLPRQLRELWEPAGYRIVAVSVDGATVMKKTTNAWHTFERDIRHDWQNWSHAERLAVRALGVSSLLFTAFYFGLSTIV
jgi:hypothetical protein